MNAIVEQPDTDWPPRLPFELALALESGDAENSAVRDVMEDHDLTEMRLFELLSNAVFTREVENYRMEVRQTGLTFKMKARAMSEAMLPEVWRTIHDKQISSTARVELMKTLAKWGDLEPAKDKDAGKTGNNFSVTINLGGESRTIDVQPVAERLE